MGSIVRKHRIQTRLGLTPTKSKMRGSPTMKIQMMESLTVKSYVMTSTAVTNFNNLIHSTKCPAEEDQLRKANTVGWLRSRPE
jgi:hypothetical protein